VAAKSPFTPGSPRSRLRSIVEIPRLLQVPVHLGRAGIVPRSVVLGSMVTPRTMADSEMRKAACVLLVNEAGEILVTSRRNNEQDFNLIGGKVDEGESFLAAALRECQEETGLSLPVNLLRELLVYPSGNEEEDFDTATFLVFANLLPQEEQQKLENLKSPEEGIILKWATWDEICNPPSSFREYNKFLRYIYSFGLWDLGPNKS
jgi:8-oxo-dGTP pyrophosphatase MutT (NUDIX family)